MPSASSRIDAVLRIVVALLGTLAIALFGAASIARHLPISPDGRYAIAFLTIIPLWVSAMCVAFLAKSGLRSLVVCTAASSFLAYLTFS